MVWLGFFFGGGLFGVAEGRPELGISTGNPPGMCRDRGIEVPGASEPPPSLKLRGCGCPSAGSVPVPTPREASERNFGKGKKVQSLDGVVGWSSAPPDRDTGVKLAGIGVGFTLGSHTRPGEIPSLLKTPLHPFPEEMLRDPGTHRDVLGGVSCPEAGMEIPRAHPSQQPREEDGEKLGIHPSLHTLPRQEPEEDLLYKAKFLLGKTLRDLLLFNLFFFSWICGEILLGAKVLPPSAVSLRMLAGLSTAPGAFPGDGRRVPFATWAWNDGGALFSPEGINGAFGYHQAR